MTSRMTSAAATIVFLAAMQPLCVADLTLDQQLIVACYKLDVDSVVKCLRNGANVNATFGESADDIDRFYNRWEGSTHMATASWTPLLAVASALDYPDPPAELGQIWKDPERARALQKQIPQAELEKRRNDAMIILDILLSHGCHLDEDDGFGATALYTAADRENVPMARKLLQFGANANTKTKAYIDGPGDTTPLHVAMHSQELMQLLIDHGADASAKDSEGHTPAEWVELNDDRTFDLVQTPDGWRVQPKKGAVK